MGKSNSKSAVTHNGDPQIRIVNNQELHGEILEQHETILYVILGIVSLQLIIMLYTLQKKRERKLALKLAKSLENIAEGWRSNVII